MRGGRKGGGRAAESQERFSVARNKKQRQKQKTKPGFVALADFRGANIHVVAGFTQPG